MGKKGEGKEDKITPLQVQKEVQSKLFHDEEVRSVLKVKDLSKKKRLLSKENQKKKQFLCVTIQGQRVRIQRIKGTKNVFVIKQTWKLEDLGRIEVSDQMMNQSIKSEGGFGLFFDKPYYWMASTPSLRNEFLLTLWKLCEEKLTKTPQSTVDLVDLAMITRERHGDEEDISVQYRDLMTAAEEKELEDLIISCVNGVTDVEELSNSLNTQLNNLEIQNIYAIIDAEAATYRVQEKIDESSQQLEAIDAWLTEYNTSLRSIKGYIEEIENRNNRMEIATQNQRKLKTELENLLQKLILSRTVTTTLTTPSFTKEKNGLSIAIDAAESLSQIFKSYQELTPAMKNTKAVQEKVKEFMEYRTSFSSKFEQFIQEQYIKLSREIAEEEKKEKKSGKTAFWFSGLHRTVYKTLISYTPLMNWLHQMEPERFKKLLDLYVQTFQNLYKHEIKYFFSDVKDLISKDSKDRKLSSLGPPIKNEFQSINVMPNDTSLSKPEKMSPEMAIAYSLNVLLPNVIEEQNFCTKFFPPRLDGDKEKDAKSTTENSENIGKMLLELFSGSIEKLGDLVETADKVDHYNDINILVYSAQFRSKCKDSLIVNEILTQVDIKARTLFNAYISEQVATINGTQVSIKRCGILPIVSKVCLATDHMILRLGGNENTTANKLVDESSANLIEAMNKWLQTIGDQQKEKYKLITRFENFHHFHKEMSKKRIKTVESFVTESETLYKSNIDQFVRYLVDYYLSEITDFFTELDKLLERLPEEEIPFQQSHSKQALGKVNARINASFIEKKMRKLQKSIEKNLSPAEGLIPRVWTTLTDYFVEKYKHFEELTRRCYKTELTMTNKEISSLIKLKLIMNNPTSKRDSVRPT
eukprot:TRINITY_DN3112_c0_g1_i3.p1 TRINITY_DN3112_c0_g1~~TRINITY_DN3112_c0_g1_i3.p1  ORF type:complete len:867 (+),score=309.07 TRINITY_DN3112_c0_g1_i3:129-2729(+)